MMHALFQKHMLVLAYEIFRSFLNDLHSPFGHEQEYIEVKDAIVVGVYAVGPVFTDIPDEWKTIASKRDG